MSSRSPIKFLDRDIQSRPQTKHSYPQNIQHVTNTAEHLVCNCHNKIEHIFELYPIDRFEKELSPDQISDYITDISQKVNVDTVPLPKLIELIKTQFPMKSDSLHNLIVTYFEFILNCQNLLNGICTKFRHKIINGLLRCCVSLAKFCNTDIEFVINYERMIQKNEGDIIKEIKDIENQNKGFKQIIGLSKVVFEQILDLIPCIKRIRASINKLYYLVTEWVDEERNYPLNLYDQTKVVKSELFTIEQRTSKNDKSIKKRQSKINTLEKQLNILKKSHLAHKRKLSRTRNSQDQITIRLEELEIQTSNRSDELKSLKKRIKSLEHIKHKPENPKKIPRYKISMEIHAMKTEEKDVEAKNFRFVNNKLALDRHQERLSKLSEELREKIAQIKAEIDENQMKTSKLKETLQDDINTQQIDMDNLKSLQLKLKDINFISSKKSSPETLRQLYSNGKLVENSKNVNLTDKLCDLLSQKVLKNWKDLYLHLPMYPERTIEQRCYDIDVIDTISAKNNITPRRQTRMCLNKWRLFYHNATPEHLIDGLKKSKNHEIAKELKIETVKSQNRFEEEESSQDEEIENQL